MDLNELRRKRGNVIQAMRALTDKAEAEKRELTTEEDAQWNAMEADQEKLRSQIDREVKQQKLDAERSDPDRLPMGDTAGDPSAEQRMAAFRNYLLNGQRGLTPNEARALQMDLAASGGYMIAPQMFVADLIQAMKDQTFMRQMATIYSVPNAASLGAPSLDANPSDATWTAEILTGSADTAMTLGKRELFPHPIAKSLLVSNKLLRASAGRVDAIVRDRLAYKIAIPQENAFLNGTGANQPLGVFTASTLGISTGRDVSTGNSATAISADGLIEAKYALKAQYQNSKSLRWIFHRDGVKRIRKLKDGEGQYLWRPGLQGDTGDTILSTPFVMSEYAPNTFTTGLYVGIIGDFSFYWIADALDISIQVVDQLYAATNQTGYFVRAESDGMPVLEEAFARVTLG